MALLNGARLSVLRRSSDDIIREVLIRTSQIKFGSEVNCTIRLKSELAEKLHCKVFVKNDKVFIANYSSKNPISVDGKVIPRRTVLSDGCLIEMCRTRFRWKFDSTLLQARTDKVKKPERTPTSSKYGKPRRTTIARKKQNIEQAGPSLISNERNSGPKKSQKTPTYTLPKNNKQLMKNMKKRFTMHSVMVDNNFEEDEEIDSEDHAQNRSAVMVSNIDHDAIGTPKKPATSDMSKNNTPFYTPDPEKENQTPAAINRTPRTPKNLALQLENSAMMILSYTPVAAPCAKANVRKTPLSSVKKATHGRRSGFLTPKNDNITTVSTTLNSPSVSKMGNSMYLIDLTTPTSKNSSFVSNSTDQSFSSSTGLIDLVTPPSKKSRTPSSAIVKSSQKGLLRSALKNASKTPLSTLRTRCATGTPKHVAMPQLDDSLSKSPKTSTKHIRTPLTPAINSNSKTRSQIRTPVINETINLSDPACSRGTHSPREQNESGGENETPKKPSVMTTDELFDTLVGRQSVRKTYSRQSNSPKKPPTSLIPTESPSDLPKTDIDIWVESVVASVTNPEPLVAESFMKMPNRTTQVRSSQYSDITPHESFTEPPVATELPPTGEPQEKTSLGETSEIVNENKLEMHDKPNVTGSRRSHTPLASKIVRSLGNKRQTIGNFFTNMFGKLTVSPVTRVSIPNENCDEVDLSSEHESEISEEEYHDSEADNVLGQSKDINPSPKLRQSLRDTRKFIGNALTSLNTSKLTLETSAEIDESLLLNETYDDNVVNQSEIAEENYDLTDLSCRPETDVSSAAALDGHLKSASMRKSTRKVVHPDFRSEISPKEDGKALQSARIVTRTSTSVSTPSVRKVNRQSLDIDISPLAVPLQLTPIKKSRKSIVPSAIKEQDILAFASEEFHLSSSVTETNVGIAEKSKLSVSGQSTSKSIHNIEAPADEMINLSTVPSMEPADFDNAVRPIQTSETTTPLRSRSSMRVSRNATSNVEQVASSEESILDELSSTVDISSVDHISNNSVTEPIQPFFEEDSTHEVDGTRNDVCIAHISTVHGYKMQLSTAEEVITTRRSRSLIINKNRSAMNMEVSTPNQSASECFPSKHIYRSRRATVSSSTPVQKNVEMKLSNVGLQMKASEKRIPRKSLAATAVSSPRVIDTTSTLIITESKSSRENQSLQELSTRFDDSMDDNLSSSPGNTMLKTTSIDESNALQQTGNHSYISHSPNKTSASGKDDRLMHANHESGLDLDATADEYLEQSIVSETVSSTPVRQRRSSLRQTPTSRGGNNIERLSASMGKPVRKPSNGTPLLRKAFFAMCTPSRSSVTSMELQAATDQMIQEMTSVNVDPNPKTPGRPSRRAKESTSTHPNGEIASVESPNKESEEELTPTKTLTDSSLISQTGSKLDVSSAKPVSVDFETDTSDNIHMLEESHDSIIGQETNPDALKIETCVDIRVLEETHDSIIGKGTIHDVPSPSKEGGNIVVDSPRIDSNTEKAIMVRSSQRKSRSRMSTVSALQSNANADINSQNDSKVREVNENIQNQTMNDLEQTSMSTKIMDKTVTEPSVKHMCTQETMVSVKTPRSTRKSLLRKNTEVTPYKNISVTSDNTASVSKGLSTADHSSPARLSHCTRRSVNVFYEADSIGSTSRHADQPTTIEEQLSESMSKQKETITEDEDTSPPLTDGSVMIGYPSDAASIGTNNSVLTCNAKSDVSNELAITDVSVSLGSPRKQTEIDETLQASFAASPSVIHKSRPSGIVATPVSVCLEQDNQVKTPASVRKSLLTNRSTSKLTLIKQLSETIVEHQNTPIINYEALTPAKKTGIISENLTDFEDEDKTPVEGNLSRSLKLGTKASHVSKKMVDVEHDFQNTAVLNVVRATLSSEQVSMLMESSPTTVTTPSSVTNPMLTRRRTLKFGSSFAATPLISDAELGNKIETPASVRKALLATPSGRKSRSDSFSATLLQEQTHDSIEQDALMSKPKIFSTPPNTDSISEIVSTPDHSRSSRASRSTRRSTISKKLLISHPERPGTIETGISTPDNDEYETENSAGIFNIAYTPENSPVRTRRSTLGTGESKQNTQFKTPASVRKSSSTSKRTTIEMSVSMIEHRDESKEPEVMKSIAISEDVLELEQSIENASLVQTSPSRKSTIGSKQATPVRQNIVEDTTQNETAIGGFVFEQQDALMKKPELFTPSNETFVMAGNAADDSNNVSTPVNITSARKSRSLRRSTIGKGDSKHLSCDVPDSSNELAVSDVSINSCPKETDMLFRNMHSSLTDSSSITCTPRSSSDREVVVSTPVSFSSKHDTQVENPASVIKSTIVKQPSESIDEQPNKSEPQKSSIINENATEIEKPIENVSPNRAILPIKSTTNEKDSIPVRQNTEEQNTQNDIYVVNVSIPTQSADLISALTEHSQITASSSAETLTSITTRRTSKFGSPFATPLMETRIKTPPSVRKSLLTTTACSSSLIECNSPAFLKEQNYDSTVEQQDSIRREHEIATPSKEVLNSENAADISKVVTTSARVSRSTRRSTIVSDDTVNVGSKSLLISRATDKMCASLGSELIVEQSEVSKTGTEVFISVLDTSNNTGGRVDASNIVASTPINVSSARASRSRSSRSVIGSRVPKVDTESDDFDGFVDFNASNISAPKQMEMSTGDLLTSSIDTQTMITSTVSKPVPVELEPGFQVRTPESIRKSLPSSRSAIKSGAKVNPDENIEPEALASLPELEAERQNNFEQEAQNEMVPVNISQSIHSFEQIPLLTDYCQKSIATSSPVTHTPCTRRSSKFGSPFATPLWADVESETIVQTKASVKKSFQKTPSDTRSQRSSVDIGKTTEASLEVSTPQQRSHARESRSTRTSTIGAKDTKDVAEVLSPKHQSEQMLAAHTDESPTSFSPLLQTENTPRIRNPTSLMKKGTTPSFVRKALLTSPTATTPVKIKHLQEKHHESIDELQGEPNSEHNFHTPAKASAVELETVESTPELVSYDARCVSTPALDTIFKTPRPIRVARTSLTVKQTPTSTVKKMHLPKTFSSGSAEKETRSSNSEELEAGDKFDQRDSPSMGQDTNNRRSTRLSTTNNVNSTLPEDNSESILTSSMSVSLSDSLPAVTDDNISDHPFVIEETPNKSVMPSASLSRVSRNSSAVDVYPDLLKHLCERVITLEHELDILADESVENVTSSVIVPESFSVTSANYTLTEIPKLLPTPAATYTIRKALRSSTVPEEQLSKTPIVNKLLRASENNFSQRAKTVDSERETTQESTDTQEGIQKLTETPITLTVQRQKLKKCLAIDLSSCNQSTPNTTADLETVVQLAKTPTSMSTTNQNRSRSTPETSMQLEGVEELMKTPTPFSNSTNREDNSFLNMQGSYPKQTRTSTDRIHSANGSSHLEEVQPLLMTPAKSAFSKNDTLSMECVQELLNTSSSNSSSKTILKPPTNPNSTEDQQPRNEGVKRILQSLDTSGSKTVKELIKSPNSSCLERIEQIFQTPTAPSTTRRSLRSGTKEPICKLDESSDEGIHRMLLTPVTSISRGTPVMSLRNDSAVHTSLSPEGLEQSLRTPSNSSAIKKKTETPVPTGDVRRSPRSTPSAIKMDSTDISTSSSNLDGIQKLLQSPVSTSISPEQLVATKPTTLSKAIDLKGVQQLPNEPYDASVDKKVDSDKSIGLEEVRLLYNTPIAASVMKRKGRSATSLVVSPCNLDDSDALTGIQNLMKTPETSPTIKKALKDTIDIERFQKPLETSIDDKKKQTSKSSVHDDTAILNDIQNLLKTPITKRGNKSQHDSTVNFEGLQSMFLTPTALSGIEKTECKSTSAVEEMAQHVSQSTSVPVTTNEPICLEGIETMLESPAVVITDKNLLKRALVNRIRGSASNTSTNKEGTHQLLATPTVISSSNNKKVSQDFSNDSHLEGIQQLLKTPPSTSVKKVDVSDAGGVVTEINTPTNTRLRRKLYTKNDPEDRTPESIKSPDVHRVTSEDYLNILAPASSKSSKLDLKMTQEKEFVNSNKDAESSVLEPIRKNPSRVSKKNKSLAEEVLAGASPEMKFVKPKQSKIVEETLPLKIMAPTSSKYDSDSKDSLLRRKVMFSENLQIKEINSPAPVGDIILKVSRGRGRNAQKVVRVIVEETSEQPSIKPARRTAKQDTAKEPSAELVDANVNTLAKRPRRGNKRAIDTVEVPDLNPQVEVTVNSTDNIINEDINDGSVSEAEPVMKRPRRAATKSNLEAKKTSTNTRPKQLDTEAVVDVEGLHDETGIDQAMFPANQRSKRQPQKTIVSPKKPIPDVKTVTKPVLNVSDDEQVTELISGRNRRGANKTTTKSNRAKSSKNNVLNEQSATDAENIAEEETSVQKSAVITNIIELEEACDSAAEPVEKNVAPERTKRAIAAKSRQRRVAAGEIITLDAVSSSASTQIHEERILETTILQTPIAAEPAEEKAAPDRMKRETAAKGRQRRAATSKTKTSDAVSSHASTQIQGLERILDIQILPTSIAEEPTQERIAPECMKQETVAKSRRRRAATNKTETSDAVSSSASTQIQDEHILDTSKLQTPVAEIPVVEQAAADSTSHDEPNPIPAKRGRGRYTRKPTPITTDKPTNSITEASPMPPPPLAVSITAQKNESSDKLTSKLAPVNKGRKKLVAQVEHQQEMHTTEESLNESHMIRTMLPATHTSTPLMQTNQEKSKAPRGGRRKLANPTVTALIAEESTPNRRSPRSRRADSEKSVQDSHNAMNAEEPAIKRSRTRTVSKMKLNDDSKDHPSIAENITTAIEQSTEDDTSKVNKLSRAPAKRGRGKTQTETEREVAKEAPKRIRKLPAKLQVADPDPEPSSNDTNDEANADPEQLSSRSQRGGKKQVKQKAYTPTKFSESNDNTTDEFNDVQKKPSNNRKPASKRPATRKKTAHIEEEESKDDVVILAKQIQDEQSVVIENATATTSRRRPLRSRK